MDQQKLKPLSEARDQLGKLIDSLPFNEQIPKRAGDPTFDHPWEIRAFSITAALHSEGQFEWNEFQSRLIDSIRSWESGHTDTAEWNYYERWMIALEDLMQSKGMLAGRELDEATQTVLAIPPNANHQHAVREPIAVFESDAIPSAGEDNSPENRQPRSVSDVQASLEH